VLESDSWLLAIYSCLCLLNEKPETISDIIDAKVSLKGGIRRRRLEQRQVSMDHSLGCFRASQSDVLDAGVHILLIHNIECD